MKNEKIMMQKKAILEEVLHNVLFDGWTEEALTHSCETLSIPFDQQVIIFPNAIKSVMEFWIEDSLVTLREKVKQSNFESLKIREKIHFLVKTFLTINEQYKLSISSAHSFLIFPPNIPFGLSLLYKVMDEMWFLAGDRSTDWNFYSKRGLLSGVYSSTLLYWLADESPDHKKSWEFLESRINDVLKIPMIKKRVSDGLKGAKSFFK